MLHLTLPTDRQHMRLNSLLGHWQWCMCYHWPHNNSYLLMSSVQYTLFTTNYSLKKIVNETITSFHDECIMLFCCHTTSSSSNNFGNSYFVIIHYIFQDFWQSDHVKNQICRHSLCKLTLNALYDIKHIKSNALFFLI